MAIYHRKRAGSAKSSSLLGPGSNGFWKRAAFTIPGTYQWIAPADGKVKVQAIGSAAGGQSGFPGSSGSYGEKVLDVLAGQALNIVMGAGSLGTGPRADNTIPAVAPGGTTSISGDPVGGTPLVLTGARGDGSNTAAAILAGMVEGRFTGPWDKAFVGAKSFSNGRTSPASASPMGPGTPGANSTVSPGWAGDGTANSFVSGVRGYLAAGDGSSEIWDLSQAEFIGGSFAIGTGQGRIGGGAPLSSSQGSKSSWGAGGQAYTGSNTNFTAGQGGDAFMWLFYDEVF